MKKLTISSDRFASRRSTASESGSVPDEKTVIYIAQRYIEREYGRRGAAAMRVTALRSGVLIVSVSDALWAQELWMARAALCEHVNTTCHATVVRRVVAQTGV